MMYVFGNSHAHFFTNSTPSKNAEGENFSEDVRSFSLGPVIAYNFMEHHWDTMVKWMNCISINPEDSILLAIGEVDCRWHLPKQAELQKRDVKDIVHECIDRFFNVHTLLKENNYKVVGWGGHPSTNSGHNDDPSNPVYGDVLTRNKITLEWNDYLEHKCKDKNILFSSVVRDLINVDGTTKMEYYRDYCHLDSEKFLPTVIAKFKQEGLL
jgi:hypothetical protein